jgi:hypothetical protein
LCDFQDRKIPNLSQWIKASREILYTDISSTIRKESITPLKVLAIVDDFSDIYVKRNVYRLTFRSSSIKT